jgi:hypothetical protein
MFRIDSHDDSGETADQRETCEDAGIVAGGHEGASGPISFQLN